MNIEDTERSKDGLIPTSYMSDRLRTRYSPPAKRARLQRRSAWPYNQRVEA